MPGLLGLELVDDAFQERAAAVEIDERRKDEEDDRVAGESQAVAEAEEVLDHRREGEDRQGRGERDPESSLETMDVLAVTAARVPHRLVGHGHSRHFRAVAHRHGGPVSLVA